MFQPSKRRVAVYIGLLGVYFAAMSWYRHDMVASWTSKVDPEDETVFEIVSSGAEEVSCDQDDFAGDTKLQERFEAKCAWWGKRVDKWKTRLTSSQETQVITAIQEVSGTGDRLMGLVGAFYHAVLRSGALDASWENLDTVFRPSCALCDKHRIRVGRNKLQPIVRLSGELRKLPHCVGIARKCNLDAHVEQNCPLYNRACISTTHCQKLAETYGKNLTMAHVLGCPAQMLLSPLPEFLDARVRWFMDGGVRTGTLRGLIEYLRDFETLAIHIRSGDGAMTNPSRYKERAEKTARDLRRCSRWVNKEMMKTSDTKWIIATDNDNIRNYFKKNFPNKTVSLQYSPQHLNSQKRDAEAMKVRELRHLFAEWFLLGKADRLLTNRAHHFGLSSFSRSAWIYNLKSEFYLLSDDRFFCYKREFVFEGNTGKVPWTCHKGTNPLLSENLKLTASLPQTHWPTKRAGDTWCTQDC